LGPEALAGWHRKWQQILPTQNGKLQECMSNSTNDDN
jgi:hypothetical protein